MAGGKETPRQKMIGMMYLVLLAMLAMNVSKEIINAFVTLDSKLVTSEEALISKNAGIYQDFEGKMVIKENVPIVKPWQDKALEVKAMADRMSNYLMLECSAMIEEGEKKPWHTKDEETGKIELLPLMDIEGKDKYDEPTRLFVGSDPGKPNERGVKLFESMHSFRDSVCMVISTYKEGPNQFSFVPTFDGTSLVEFDSKGRIVNHNALTESMAKQKVNEKDTTKIIQIYRALSLAPEMENHGKMYKWQAAMFDHAPIVAAAAMFSALRVDVRNAESIAIEFILGKVDAPTFNFNKIEPLAFASTGYINQGDSLTLSVMIAAYDSTEVPIIKYGVDADTANPADWKQINGKIGLRGDSPGDHKVKGVIMVKQKGELVPKNWSFNYSVGQPMGVVAQPELRVLYWGYPNLVEGTASGYDPSKVTLSGSGVSLSSKGKGQYIANVSRGTRTAKISISAKKDDGGSVSLGSFDFVCKPLPPAEITFAGVTSGSNASYTAVRNQTKVTVQKDPSSPLQSLTYTVTGGTVYVAGLPGAGNIGSGGSLDAKAKNLLNQSKGKTVIIEVKYKDPSGVTRMGTGSFKVN